MTGRKDKVKSILISSGCEGEKSPLEATEEVKGQNQEEESTCGARSKVKVNVCAKKRFLCGKSKCDTVRVKDS